MWRPLGGGLVFFTAEGGICCQRALDAVRDRTPPLVKTSQGEPPGLSTTNTSLSLSLSLPLSLLLRPERSSQRPGVGRLAWKGEELVGVWLVSRRQGHFFFFCQEAPHSLKWVTICSIVQFYYLHLFISGLLFP
ncbi:unnamed protein product [Boreogadus saida]